MLKLTSSAIKSMISHHTVQHQSACLSELGERAAALLHEFKSPLTVILMSLTSLASETMSEQNRVRLELALKEAIRLKRLANKSLMYAKYPTLKQQQLDLNGLFRQTLQLAHILPLTANRRLRFQSFSSKAWILGDRDQLKQVFINLIENACEAVSAGEEILCRLNVSAANRQVCISIHNWGEPVPSQILPQLTKPFVTTKSGGTGLGLTVAKQIIEAHSGELEIQSSRESGTTVMVRLPALSLPTKQIAQYLKQGPPIEAVPLSSIYRVENDDTDRTKSQLTGSSVVGN